MARIVQPTDGTLMAQFRSEDFVSNYVCLSLFYPATKAGY